MGNDPGNGTDPSGCFFGKGGGLGCSATKGMSGFGGFSSAKQAINVGGGIITQMLGMISTVAQVANSIGGASRNSGVFGSNANAGNGSTNATDGGGADNNPCNCPPGYGTRPKPGGDQQPYFFSPDDAARYWAYIMRKEAITKAREASSEIFAIRIGSGKSSTLLYGHTKPVAFKNDRSYNESPGPGDPNHSKGPAGATIVGHIHYHWSGSASKSKGTSSDNNTFSEPDKDGHKKVPEKFMYVLGASGILWVKYPEELPLVNGWPNTDQGKIKPIDGGFYNPNKPQPLLCPCYKQ